MPTTVPDGLPAGARARRKDRWTMTAPASAGLLAHASRARALVVELLAGEALELPLLPFVASEVLALCAQEATDARRLADVVHRDQALAANLLRIANSPAFLPSVPIVSLQQAISRLGMRQISGLVLSVAARGAVFTVPGHEALLAELWRHSVLAACVARELARARRSNVEVAFLCGLLHDAGRPVVLHALSRNWRGGGGELEPAVVWPVLDEFHTQVGHALARRWQLPAAVAEAIAHHHAPELATPQHADVVQLVALADLIALVLRDPQAAPAAADFAECPWLEALNLYGEDLDAVLARAGELRRYAEGLA
jgi:putative nucleotidyltransferase with HDIG domain